MQGKEREFNIRDPVYIGVYIGSHKTTAAEIEVIRTVQCHQLSV